MPSPSTGPNRHRIQRQILELDLGAGAHGPELQEAVARSLRERAVPELEAVFDRVAGPDEILRLDRLEIDLGSIEGTDWEPQFRRRLVEQMARSLAQFKPVPEGSGGPMGRGEGREAEPLRQFLFFLAHGRLPWWGGKPGKGWPETMLPHLDETGWTALHQLLRANFRARLRLINGVSDQFLATAIETWTGLLEAVRVLVWLTPVGLSASDSRQWRCSFWATLLDWIMADGFRAGRGAELMEDLLQLREGLGGPIREDDGQASRGDREASGPDGTGGLSPLPQPWREWLAAAQASRDRSEPESVRRYARRNGPGPGEEPPPAAPELSVEHSVQPHGQPEVFGHALEGTGARSLAPVPRRSTEGRHPVPPPQEDEVIYLEGAGAVILHPFLEELFRGRSLLAQRDFRDGAARHRAVHLLGFLSFGREGVPEYELLLAKLLCGLPFEEPLEPAELDDDDRAACDSLLRAVLGHWTALRSSSPNWLREQFFLREGKLEPVDAGWRVTVERRAQDVLLARLPWGLGVIGLPWMDDRIYVRWTE